MRSPIDNDYKYLIAHLEKKSLLHPKYKSEIKQLLKKIHLNVFSLAIWEFKLKIITPNPALVFLKEMTSEGIHSILLSLNGFKKDSNLAIRGIIEDAIRYVYYFDHRIELKKLDADPKSYMKIKDLTLWIDTHPEISTKIQKIGLANKLETRYFKLSQQIHGTTTLSLQMMSSIKEIEFNMSYFRIFERELDETVKDVNFMLTTFHKKEFLKFDNSNQQIILSTMPDSYKKILWNPQI